MIAFTCPACTMLLNVHDDQAGTKVPCPSCGQRLRVPQCPESESPTIMGKFVLPTPRTSGPDEGARTIRCVCPHCQAIIKAPPRAAGAKAPCPRCSLLVEIPVPKADYVEEPVSVVPSPPPADSQSGRTPPMPQPTPARFDDRPSDAALVPLTCGQCHATVYVPRQSAEAGLPCPRCARPIMLMPAPENRPDTREGPVIVNIVNNVGEQEGKRPPPRKAKRKALVQDPRRLASAVIVALAVAVVVGYWLYIGYGPDVFKNSWNSLFGKSPQELALGRWQYKDERNPETSLTVVFYKDGVADLFPSNEPAGKGTYKFIDDKNLELGGPRGSFRVQFTFQNDDAFVWIFPDGKRHTLRRVK